MKIVLAAALSLVALTVAGAATATAPPVGALPAGPVSTITTQRGQLVSVALPARAGLSWRIARPFDGHIVREVTEADVGRHVVIVFKAVGRGRTKLVYAQTRGESSRAQAARTFSILVR
jgi:hypothetical protein